MPTWCGWLAPMIIEAGQEKEEREKLKCPTKKGGWKTWSSQVVIADWEGGRTDCNVRGAGGQPGRPPQWVRRKDNETWRDEGLQEDFLNACELRRPVNHTDGWAGLLGKA